jgi:ubiquinone/menaquinone biosynthesis C-methylase UbiE
MAFDKTEFKNGQRRMWAMGDYPDLARTIEEVAEALVERAGVRPGHTVLDVATGSGNVALAAAAAGAEVTGLDITPELLDAARARAAGAGVRISWREGDAEELPFVDGGFERVLSCFGVMFAPDQQRAADELARVCAARGAIAVSAWTPEGVNGVMFRTIGSFMPPPPPELRPAVLWGSEDHVANLFAGRGLELEFERRAVAFEAESPAAWVSYTERVLGPTIMAKAMLEAQGRWEELRSELVGLYERFNEADDGTLRFSAEYLLSVARRPG